VEGSSASADSRGWKGLAFGSSPVGLQMISRLMQVGLVAGSVAMSSLSLAGFGLGLAIGKVGVGHSIPVPWLQHDGVVYLAMALGSQREMVRLTGRK